MFTIVIHIINSKTVHSKDLLKLAKIIYKKIWAVRFKTKEKQWKYKTIRETYKAVKIVLFIDTIGYTKSLYGKVVLKFYERETLTVVFKMKEKQWKIKTPEKGVNLPKQCLLLLSLL